MLRAAHPQLPAHAEVRARELEPVKRAEIDPWTPDECAAFLTAIRNERLYPLFLPAITTGMRRGELCGLRWCSERSPDASS